MVKKKKNHQQALDAVMCLKNMDYTASTDALQQERVSVQALKP